jgi:hypothetical protein
MNLVQKLLGLLHRVFDPDPEQFLALQFQYDGLMVWTVADNVLSTSVTDGSGENLSINLVDYTISGLINFISQQAGYTVSTNAAPDKLALSARTLIDGSKNQFASNGDHLYAYASLIWVFMSAVASELRAAGAQIPQAIRQMTVTEASDDWIDELGGYYGVKRQQGESDASYGPRIIAEVVRPRCNNIAMEAAISLYTGQSTKVTDVVIYGASFPKYDSTIFRDSVYQYQSVSAPQYGLFDVEYGYDLLGGDDVTDFSARVRGIIDTLRAAGTHLRSLVLKAGSFGDTLTPPIDEAMPLRLTFNQADTLTAPNDDLFTFDAALGAFNDSAASGTESEFNAIHYNQRYNSVRTRNSAINFAGGTIETFPVLAKEWLFTTGSLPADVSVSRASVGARFNAQGVLEFVGADLPRFDYDPYTRTTRGLMIEEARTNLLPYSSDFTNAAWGKTACAASVSAMNGPDNATAASLIVPNTSNTSHYVGSTAIAVTASKAYTESIFVKAAGYTQVRLLISDNIGQLIETVFDTATGTVIAGSTAAIITRMANGWWRVALTAITSVGASTLTLQAWVYSAGSGVFTGDGTSGLYLWHAQMELGAFGTTPIVTAGSAATRAADLPTISSLSPWYNASLGTFIVHATDRMPSTANGYTLSIGSDSSNYMAFGQVTTAGPTGTAAFIKAGAGPVGPDLFNRSKMALAWNVSAVNQAADGVALGGATHSGIPVVSSIWLGRGHSGGPTVTCYIRKMTYWAARFPDGTLKIMTEA